MIVDGLEAHLDHFWEFAGFGGFLCDLRIGVELTPKPP